MKGNMIVHVPEDRPHRPSIIMHPSIPAETTDMCNVIVYAANQVWDRGHTEKWFNPWKISNRPSREDRKVIER